MCGAQGGVKLGKASEEMGGGKKMSGKKASLKDWWGEGRLAMRKQRGQGLQRCGARQGRV